MTVDPWGGFNEGMKNLNDTFTNIRKEDRQSALDAQTAAAARQSLAMGDIQLQTAQRTEQNRQDAVDAAANAQPSVRTTLYDQQGPPQPVDNTAGMSQREALGRKIADLRGKEYNPALHFGDNDMPPGATQDAQVAPLQAQMDAIPATAQVAGKPFSETQTLPPVAVQEQAPVTDDDRLLAMIHSYTKNGEPEKAAALKTSIITHANQVVALTGNPNDGLAIVNHATGANFRYSPLPSLDAVTNDGQLVGYIDKNKYKELTDRKPDGTPGMASLDAMKAALIPLDLGGGGKAVMEYIAAHPDATPDELAGVGAKNGVSLSKMIPLLNETVKSQNEKNAMVRQENQFAHSEKMQRDAQAHTDKLFAQRLQNQNGTAADIDSAAQMLAEGKLDLSKDLSRISGGDRLALIAKAKTINPNYDPRLTAAQNTTLTSLVRTRGLLNANEIDANKNFDQLIALHAKLGNSMIPAVNQAMNYMKEGMGAPEPGTAAGVAYEALTQYARVINKTTGGASVTDSARKEANNLLPVLRLNNAQLTQRIAQYRVTMHNTMASQDQAISQVRQGAPVAPNGASSATAYVYDAATGTLKQK